MPTITLAPCPSEIKVAGAECGTLEVYEDRQAQTGRTISYGCVPKLIAQFIEAASADSLDAECVQTLRRPPFFTSYTGPSPMPRSKHQDEEQTP